MPGSSDKVKNLPDYYKILGVASTATRKEIHEAVLAKRAALINKMDKVSSTAVEPTAKKTTIGGQMQALQAARKNVETISKLTKEFNVIRRAAAVLSDPRKRQVYDLASISATVAKPKVRSFPLPVVQRAPRQQQASGHHNKTPGLQSGIKQTERRQTITDLEKVRKLEADAAAFISKTEEWNRKAASAATAQALEAETQAFEKAALNSKKETDNQTSTAASTQQASIGEVSRGSTAPSWTQHAPSSPQDAIPPAAALAQLPVPKNQTDEEALGKITEKFNNYLKDTCKFEKNGTVDLDAAKKQGYENLGLYKNEKGERATVLQFPSKEAAEKFMKDNGLSLRLITKDEFSKEFTKVESKQTGAVTPNPASEPRNNSGPQP